MPDTIRLPSFRLDNRVAMVTGSGAGIGAGIATGLAEAGADLVLGEEAFQGTTVGGNRLRGEPALDPRPIQETGD